MLPQLRVLNNKLCSNILLVTTARCLSVTAPIHAGAIQNVTVIGSGLMGSGIAQVSAQSKLNVTLVDQEQSIVNKAQKSIENSLRRVAKKKHEGDASAQDKLVSGVLSKITLSTDIHEAVSKADLVIEAIMENVAAKQKLFSDIEPRLQQHAILATNTSSLKLADIGQNLKNKMNFGGLHFFNPVPMMKLLEVVRHAETSDETFDRLVAYGQSIGKVTVSCKDTPGFIVNRLLVPYMLEALRMVERGDASKEDVDQAMRLGAGYPMGPFELADYVGLDTTLFIQQGWAKNYPDEPLFKRVKVLEKTVGEGKLGKKSGEGFYKYETGK